MAPTLTSYTETRDDLMSGEEVLAEIFDLIRRRLPRLAVDDPVRHCLLRLAPMLNMSLGGPPVRHLVEGVE